MIYSDYAFGTTDLYCDGPSCKNSEQFEGFDGHVDFRGAIKEAREKGWIIKMIDGDWMHFCDQECHNRFVSQT